MKSFRSGLSEQEENAIIAGLRPPTARYAPFPPRRARKPMRPVFASKVEGRDVACLLDLEEEDVD